MSRRRTGFLQFFCALSKSLLIVRSFGRSYRTFKDWFQQASFQLRFTATLIMFELSLLTFGTVLALSLVVAVIRPQKAGDPFYI